MNQSDEKEKEQIYLQRDTLGYLSAQSNEIAALRENSGQSLSSLNFGIEKKSSRVQGLKNEEIERRKNQMDFEIFGEQQTEGKSPENTLNPFATRQPLSRSSPPNSGLMNMFSEKAQDFTDRTFGITMKQQQRANEHNISIVSEQLNEKSVEKIANDLNDDQNFKRSIELLNGQPVRNTRNIIKNSNRLQLGLYIGFQGFFWLLAETIFRFDHLLLGIQFWMVQINEKDFSSSIHMQVYIIGSLSFVINLILNIVYDRKLRAAAEKINSKSIEKIVFAKKKQIFQTTKWGELEVGDIIQVQKSQELPADVLILDISGQLNEQEIHVIGGNLSDIQVPELKRSHQGTSNKTNSRITIRKIVEQISGILKWECSNSGHFSGTLKLNDNPSAFEIKMENIILRGSSIYYTQDNQTQVTCLVLNVGDQCIQSPFRQKRELNAETKMNLNQLNLRKRFQITKQVNLLGIIQLLIIVILSTLISITENYVLKETDMIKFVANKVSQLSVFKKTIVLSRLLMGCYPFMMHVTFELCALTHILFILWDISLVPCQVVFNNFESICKLGNVNNIVMSRSCIFNKQLNQKIVSLQFSNSFFMNQSNGNDKIQHSSMDFDNGMHESFSSDENENNQTRDSIDYLPNEVKKLQTFGNLDLQVMITTNTNPELQFFFELLKAATICHRAANKGSLHNDSKKLYKSFHRTEIAQLMFANSYGYRFNQRKNKVITINDSLQQFRFQELLYQQIDRFDTILTVQIIKPIGGTNQNCQMILKGELHEMKKFLVSDLDLDAEVSKYLQKGIATMAFATKTLDFEEAQALSKQVQEWVNANSDNNERIAEELLLYAQDSLLIGILGVNKQCNLRNSLVLEEAHRNGIKVWMITDDSEFRSLTDYNQLKFLQNCSQPLNIKGSNEREVEESIKNGLRIITEKRTQMNQTLNTTSRTATKKSLSTPNSHQQTTPSTMSRQRRKLKKSQEGQEPKHVIFFNGNSLKYILKDETLKKSFLLLCSMCNFMIGSKTNANQKANLVKEISIYNKIADIGEVLGIVSSTHDQFIIDYADITVGLNYKYQKSDCMAAVDIQLQDFYGVSYLLFKHGTFYVRRLAEIQTLYNHRTLLINIITIYFICQNCLSAVAPFLNLFFTVFMVVITPAVYLIIGSTHKSFGFDYFYRIFGEYRYNFLSQGVFTSYQFIAHAMIDFVIFISIYILCWASVSENPREMAGQNYIDLQTMQVYNVFIIVIIFFIRLFNREIVIINANILCSFFLLISLVFTLESSSEQCLGFIFQSPQLLMHLLFVILMTLLSNFGFFVARTHLLNNCKQQMKFYQDIEEKVFFEEYEDPTTEFRILESDCRKNKLETELHQKNILGINKNMMKLHRSDSMDEILEKINSQGDNNEKQAGKKFDNSNNLINKFTLKLSDINKELEYNTQVQDKKIGVASVKKIYVLLLLFVFLLVEGVIFKLIGLRNKGRTDLIDTSYTQKTVFSSNVSIIYVQVCHIVLALIAIYLITRTKDLRLDLIILGYIFLLNILMCVQLIVDPSNSVNDFTYFFVLAFSFINRQHYVYSVALFTITTTIINAEVRFNLNMKNMKLLQETAFYQFQNGIKAYQLDQYFQIVFMFYIVLIWFIYAYQDERAKKIQFVTSFRKSKEFNKLLQIMNILLPSLVRQRIQDGQKNFSDSQGEVTIIFIDVDQFDAIVSSYSSKELIDLLDSLYNAFDQLCEKYGLSKVETVGKTYMACAGLKFFETSIDQKLLGNHQSVRVTDFAFEALAVVEKKIMKDGTRAAVKIGIHSGEVVSGVVGETKPQFSLIGETVNKTSRVCSKCPSRKILVSKETHQHLCQFSNNFKFKMMEVEMKGIGTESVYTVERKNVGFLKRNQKGRQAKQGFNKNTQKTAALQARTNEQENQDNDNGVETYRSMQPSDNFSEQVSHTQNSMQLSDDENKSNEVSEDEDDVLMLQQLNFAQFKDDRLISKNPSLNTLYNCVERPRFLMQFELKEKENEFYSTLLRDNKSVNALFLFLKCVFDSILSIGLAIKYIHLDMMWVCIFWIMFHFCIQFTVNYYTEKSKTPESNGLILLNYTVTGLVELTLTIIPNFLFSSNSSVRESTKMQIMVVMMMVFVFKGFPIRYGLLTNVILSLTWLILEISFGVWKQVDIMTLITNQVIFVICLLLLGLMSFNREMTMRKQYNRDRIVDVEIKKTDELLSKLVPVHVLGGLKNDERIVEQVENVTLLYTDMVGFTAFSKSVKHPQEVVQLLSQLFSKFDQLAEAKGVYKVHTIGDCYVVMGYTGQVSKYRRNENTQIEEAYRVVQVGFEMIEIIKNVRENAKDPNLKNLDMRIGIHTGKITGGIIGTKVVRYDIFGNDVLIANKMESNGVDSQVVISESTFNLLNKNQNIMDSMEFTPHKEVDIPALNKTVNSFLVEQIIIQDESESYYSSEDESEDKGTNSKEGTTKSSKNRLLQGGISNSSGIDEDDDEEGHDSDQSRD